ncbi:MAG: ArnT family glycosyltransferase, partial [Anaerolineales bacterium]
MLEHGFYEGLPLPDPDRLGGSVLGLQYPQLDEPPFYYLLASLPVWLLRNSSIETQLYGARLISLSLYLVSVVAAWGVARELTRPENPIRIIVPLTAALLPGFTDLMTAVNNDVGAVAVFSLFLWGSVRLVRLGFSLRGLLWVVFTAAACYWTKSTAFIAVPLSALVILLAWVRGARRKWVWVLLLVGGLLSTIGVLSLEDAAYWYRSTSQKIPTRARDPLAPLGEHVLQLDVAAEVTPRWLRPLYQPIPLDDVAELQGKRVTFGVWMWAARPGSVSTSVEVRTPVLTTESQDLFDIVSISETPTFYAFAGDLAENTTRLWITLAPARGQSRQFTVFYDGFVLVEGEYPVTDVPAFFDAEGRQGTWGEQLFQNLVRNPSIEQAWPHIRPRFDDLGAKILPDNTRPSMLLSSLLDWQGAGWYYRFTGQNMLQTFWGRFGWGHVTLIGPNPYLWLGIITNAGIVGAGLFLARKWRSLPGDNLILLGLVLVGVWGAAFSRGSIFIFTRKLFIPGARYAYPAIAPTLLLLAAGWQELMGYLNRWLRAPLKAQYMVYLLGFLILDIISLITITHFYG